MPGTEELRGAPSSTATPPTAGRTRLTRRHVTELARQSLVFMHDVGFRGGPPDSCWRGAVGWDAACAADRGKYWDELAPHERGEQSTIAKTMSRTLQAPFSVVCVWAAIAHSQLHAQQMLIATLVLLGLKPVRRAAEPVNIPVHVQGAACCCSDDGKRDEFESWALSVAPQ